MTTPRFLVVTPTFQSQDFLDECIQSVISQAGDFDLRYHIQDGGSTDGTWAIIERWRKVLQANPGLYGRVTLTAEQAPDAGMYDAITKAFGHLRPRVGDRMTWINSDDLLASGAFKAVAGCMADNPTVALCGGRTALIDAESRLDHVSAPMIRSQTLMAAGLYDGRKLPFIMQEGTFWTGRLWKAVGGLDTTFRLAGDWDLWRRMAEHAPYLALDALTGFHRRRPGQLSGDIDAYHREVDRALAGEPGERYERLFQEYQRIDPDNLNFDNSAFPGWVGIVDAETRTWRLKEVYGEPLPPPMTIANGRRALGLRGEVISGGRSAEGPYPDQGLPAGVRWINEAEAWLRLPYPTAGCVRVRLTCRPGAIRTRVVLESGGEILVSALISPQTPERDQILEFDCWVSPGDNPIRLTTSVSEGNPELRLLLIDLTYEPIVTAQSEPVVSSGGPAVVVVARTEPQGLAATLVSLRRQTRRASAVTVVTDSDATSVRDVVRAFKDVTLVTTSEDQLFARAIEAIVQTASEFGLGLTAGQELSTGALEGLQASSSNPSAAVITGATLDVDELQRAQIRFRDDSNLPWAATLEIWRTLEATPLSADGGWAQVLAALERKGSGADRVPVVVDVRRGRPESSAALRALWLLDQTEVAADHIGSALADLGLDVRRIALPVRRDRATQSAAFHYEAWAPTQVFASAAAMARLAGEPVVQTAVTMDADLVARAQEVERRPEDVGSLLELCLALGAWVGVGVGDFAMAPPNPARQDGDNREPDRDRFGAEVCGFIAGGSLDLARTWTARAGFGRERAPDLSANLATPYRWIEGRHAQIGVYCPSTGLRRLVIWLRSPSKRQRLIIRCGGREAHECEIGGAPMTEDQRVSVSVELMAGWNVVDLEFSSTVTRGDQTFAAILTGVDVKPARHREVGPLGAWRYIAGADFEEPPYPQFGLPKPFRWGLNPCIVQVTPPVAGPSLVTVQYQTAVAGQTLTAYFEDTPVGCNEVEDGDLAAVRILTFQIDLPQGGGDVEFKVDHVMQDGRSLAFILDTLTVEPAGVGRSRARTGQLRMAPARQLLRRIARAARARLRL